jgi:hypothetical protein
MLTLPPSPVYQAKSQEVVTSRYVTCTSPFPPLTHVIGVRSVITARWLVTDLHGLSTQQLYGRSLPAPAVRALIDTAAAFSRLIRSCVEQMVAFLGVSLFALSGVLVWHRLQGFVYVIPNRKTEE